MPQGDKSIYSDKQVREAEHIAEGYKKRGNSEGWSKKVAWATVNKLQHFGLLPLLTGLNRLHACLLFPLH